MISEELKSMALLRDEDLQALFVPHLNENEIVEDVARLAFQTIKSAKCSDLSVLGAHLARRCRNKAIYDEIMRAFSLVKTPIRTEGGKASFQSAVLFLEKYLRWRKVATIASDMGSQDFEKPFPVIEKYDRLMSACQFKVDIHNNDSLFCFVLFFKLNGLMISGYLGLMQSFSHCGDRGDLFQVPSEG